jgi:hypothetical protein
MKVKLDVGCGRNKRKGYIGVDIINSKDVDLIFNISKYPWPIKSDTAEEIVLDNVIEHIPDIVGIMNELHRIAKGNAVVEIIYPYWRSFGAYSDPTHIHYLNEYMIDYFLQPGSSNRTENKYSFYTNKYWSLLDRQLITYPIIKYFPNKMLSFLSRHFVDIVHGVKLLIRPIK